MHTATSILDERTKLLIARELIEQLHHRYDSNTLSLCASLLPKGDPSSQLKEELVEYLLQNIRDANLDDTVALLQRAQWLTESVLAVLPRHVASACLSHQTQDLQLNFATVVRGGPDDGQAVTLLKLARRLISENTSQGTTNSLLEVSIECMQSTLGDVADAAKDLCYALLSLLQPSLALVERLYGIVVVLFNDLSKHTLAFTLWLRVLLAFPAETCLMLLERGDYWSRIRSGLQTGDSEQRKLSMEILRQSVAIAVDRRRLDLVTTMVNATPAMITQQFARFLTVFETIVFLRYGNLIAEVDKSLNTITAATSALDLPWQYLLLEIGMQPTIQDQTRRYLGKWIISGHMSARYSSAQFLDFFRDTLLPWMVEGHLYTSSLALSSDTQYHCAHGEQVSQFVQDLLTSRTSTSAQSSAIDIILSFLLAQRDVFAFAVTYVFHGWTKAQALLTAHHLTVGQKKFVLQISDWRRLPFAAKRFLRYCCWHLLTNKPGYDEPTRAQLADNETALARLQSLEMTFAAPGKEVNTSKDSMSQRDLKIFDTIKRCAAIEDSVSVSDLATLATKLEDIWSDAEYLEFPRSLITVLPQTFFNANVTALLTGDGALTHRLQQLIDTVLANLLEQTQTKSYLLSPMMITLRQTFLQNPAATIQTLDIENIITKIAYSPPQPKTDLQFEYATLNLLIDLRKPADLIHTDDRTAAYETAGYAAYIDLISRLGTDQKLITAIIDVVMSRWLRQKPPVPTISAFKSSLQLQILVLCCEQLSAATDELLVKELLHNMFKLLSIEPLPRYRFLLSWSILRLLSRFPKHQADLLGILARQDHHSNPKYVAALMKLSVDLLHTENVDQSFADRLASIFVALSASSKIIIRHESQWSFASLMKLARKNGWCSITDNPAHVSLEDYIRSLPRYDDPPRERVLSTLDMSKGNTLTELVEGRWTDLDYNKPPYTRRADFIALYEHDRSTGIFIEQPSCLPLGEPVARGIQAADALDNYEEPDILGPRQMNQEEAIALQTKGSAYLRDLLGDAKAQQSSTLIVIASLIDNPHNLGGLSRVSEIFGAQALYVRDPRVIAEKEFASVAVSSYNHIDIMPLQVENMPQFLACKRKGGWTIVGVEQTDRSMILGEPGTLPKKSVLIIGNEKTGTPGKIISECDVLVEIPQKGVTRSMNVQTVAAVVLYEHNRLHGG